MIKSQFLKANEEGNFILTKKQFLKLNLLEAPVHVGMNTFPHLFIQFVELDGNNIKILWDFSKLKSSIKTNNFASYPWDYEFIVSANTIPKKKSKVTFIEYQKDGMVIAIQL